jgi:transposase-like protein
MNTEFPETLVEAIRYFSDPELAFNFMAQLRWPDGVKCPRCGTTEIRCISTRKTWECKHCTEKKQFSIRVGTIFEDSPLSLDKWLAAIWMIANAKNGVSSYEVHRAIGVTQKTAWFMLQRIRLAMQTGTFEKLKGDVEIDETFIGGLGRHMHPGRRRRLGPGTGGVGKTVVLGFLERGGKARTMLIPSQRRSTIDPTVRQHVESGSQVFTDELSSYDKLSPDYLHQVICHAEAYVRGKIHTNGMENYWSLLKRMLKGTYVSVDPVHLFRYLDEQAFRFNNRKTNDSARFLKAAFAIIGKRLTYDELIGKAQPA